MDKTISKHRLNFEQIRHLDNEYEFWLARELMPLLGYKNWRDFHNAIEKAKIACEESGNIINSNFEGVLKIVETGISQKNIQDFKLSRYACYLIAMNGDSRKMEIAQAQTYFAIQTRKQEIFEQLSEDQKRLKIREEVSVHNKKLFETAKNSGVNNFAEFNDAGYLGLYGMRNKEIAKKKNLGKDSLLDRAGATELAANLFRITQTDEQLDSQSVDSQTHSEKIHFMVGGKIRQTIKDIGGTMPEELPPQKHIKEIKKQSKKLSNKP
jgi:DNA-damage-inducible protein D